MITTKELAGKGYNLYAGDFQNGHSGVLLTTAKGSTIEVIALTPWHVDQDDDLQFADDYGREHHWFFDQFQAGALSNQARKLIADYVREHAEIVKRACDGDEEAIIPQPDFLK